VIWQVLSVVVPALITSLVDHGFLGIEKGTVPGCQEAIALGAMAHTPLAPTHQNGTELI